MTSRRTHRKAAKLTSDTAELALAAPQVVAHRVGRMLTAGSTPSAADVAEFQRMGAEKVAAFFESWNAMAAQALRLQAQQLRFSPAAWWAPVVDLAAAGLAPVHRRATANAKRLARRRSKR
jgi:hypothetical protein